MACKRTGVTAAITKSSKHSYARCSGLLCLVLVDEFSYDLMKTRSLEIGSVNYCIALKFDRHIDWIATDVSVKF